MSNIFTYSPKEISIVIGGYTISGWSSVTITPGSPKFTIVKGIRGKNTRLFNPDQSAEVSISVPLTNDLNMAFNMISKFDIANKNGRLNILIKDHINGEVFQSNDAFLTGESSRNYSESVSDRVWSIQCMTAIWDHNGANWGISSWFNSLS